MLEELTEAIILDKQPDKDLDSSFVIFTRNLGKVYGKATSSRKIVSKLAGHLEPGTYLQIRLAGKNPDNSFRIVEALSRKKRADLEIIRFLMFVNQMTPTYAKDEVLFMFIKKVIEDQSISSKTAHKGALKIIGLDPDEARCQVCGHRQIAYFSSQDIIFLCRQCGKKRCG